MLEQLHSEIFHIEKYGYMGYHDKLCYYLVHARKRRREFGLLHDRMLNEIRKNEPNLLKFLWLQKDCVIATRTYCM